MASTAVNEFIFAHGCLDNEGLTIQQYFTNFCGSIVIQLYINVNDFMYC